MYSSVLLTDILIQLQVTNCNENNLFFFLDKKWDVDGKGGLRTGTTILHPEGSADIHHGW